jgi:hypothetical protein
MLKYIAPLLAARAPSPGGLCRLDRTDAAVMITPPGFWIPALRQRFPFAESQTPNCPGVYISYATNSRI